jgi:hypothetical protein
VILLEKIYSTEEQMERASKVLKLNVGTDYEPRLLAASSKKPTISTKWLSFNGPGVKPKGASSIQRQLQLEKEKAEKALRLNGF